MTVDAVKRRMLQVKDWTNQIKYEKKFAGKCVQIYPAHALEQIGDDDG